MRFPSEVVVTWKVVDGSGMKPATAWELERNQQLIISYHFPCNHYRSLTLSPRPFHERTERPQVDLALIATPAPTVPGIIALSAVVLDTRLAITALLPLADMAVSDRPPARAPVRIALLLGLSCKRAERLAALILPRW